MSILDHKFARYTLLYLVAMFFTWHIGRYGVGYLVDSVALQAVLILLLSSPIAVICYRLGEVFLKEK